MYKLITNISISFSLPSRPSLSLLPVVGRPLGLAISFFSIDVCLEPDFVLPRSLVPLFLHYFMVLGLLFASIVQFVEISMIN